VQEEIRQNTKDEASSKCDDEDNCMVVGNEMKGKGKKSQSKGDYSRGQEEILVQNTVLSLA